MHGEGRFLRLKPAAAPLRSTALRLPLSCARVRESQDLQAPRSRQTAPLRPRLSVFPTMRASEPRRRALLNPVGCLTRLIQRAYQAKPLASEASVALIASTTSMVHDARRNV